MAEHKITCLTVNICHKHAYKNFDAYLSPLVVSIFVWQFRHLAVEALAAPIIN